MGSDDFGLCIQTTVSGNKLAILIIAIKNKETKLFGFMNQKYLASNNKSDLQK